MNWINQNAPAVIAILVFVIFILSGCLAAERGKRIRNFHASISPAIRNRLVAASTPQAIIEKLIVQGKAERWTPERLEGEIFKAGNRQYWAHFSQRKITEVQS